MNEEKRYACSDEATSEQAAETEAFSGATVSCLHCSMAEDKRQMKIADLLHVGAENGLSLRELVQMIGEDERLIRRRIQSERKSGTLILSDCRSGYFLPADANYVRRFIRSMSRRSREIAEVSRAAEDALAAMLGQETLGGW